ncbi:hypothetical protein ACGFZR_15230 [Streptomyces sp. NPDC048241]|uniref:hypothetical protein n=1 Tax=Streptomyces sp. NPDC048241 TaxID=3365521 RepID=UPI0037247967
MGWKKTAAEKLDDTAANLHKRYGKTGDRIANTVLAPVRNQINTGCTRCERGTCKH